MDRGECLRRQRQHRPGAGHRGGIGIENGAGRVVQDFRAERDTLVRCVSHGAVVGFGVRSMHDDVAGRERLPLPAACGIRGNDGIEGDEPGGVAAAERHPLVGLDGQGANHRAAHHPECTREAAAGDLFNPALPVHPERAELVDIRHLHNACGKRAWCSRVLKRIRHGQFQRSLLHAGFRLPVLDSLVK